MADSSPEGLVAEARELGEPGFDVARACVGLDLPAPPCRGLAIEEDTAFADDTPYEGRGGRRQIDDVDGQPSPGLLDPRGDAPQRHRTAGIRGEHDRHVEVTETLAARRGAEEIRPANRRILGEGFAKRLQLRSRADLGTRAHHGQRYPA